MFFFAAFEFLLRQVVVFKVVGNFGREVQFAWLQRRIGAARAVAFQIRVVYCFAGEIVVGVR